MEYLKKQLQGLGIFKDLYRDKEPIRKSIYRKLTKMLPLCLQAWAGASMVYQAGGIGFLAGRRKRRYGRSG